MAFTLLKQTWDILKIRHMVLFFISSSDEIHSITSTIPAEIREINASNVDKVRDFRDDIDPEKFEHFLEEGDVGVYAIVDAKVVGHLWASICRKSDVRIDGFIKLYKNEAFIHFATVYEKYRGKNIYPAMLSTLSTKLIREKGIQRIFIITEQDNISSIRGIEKVGFRIYQNRLYLPVYKIIRIMDSVSSSLFH